MSRPIKDKGLLNFIYSNASKVIQPVLDYVSDSSEHSVSGSVPSDGNIQTVPPVPTDPINPAPSNSITTLPSGSSPSTSSPEVDSDSFEEVDYERAEELAQESPRKRLKNKRVIQDDDIFETVEESPKIPVRPKVPVAPAVTRSYDVDSIFEDLTAKSSPTAPSVPAPVPISAQSILEKLKKRGRPSDLAEDFFQLGQATSPSMDLSAQLKQIADISKAYYQRMDTKAKLAIKDKGFLATRCPYWRNMGIPTRQCKYEQSSLIEDPFRHCQLHAERFLKMRPQQSQLLEYHPLDTLLIGYEEPKK